MFGKGGGEMDAQGFQRRLLLLHRYNAWSVAALALTGLILYVPDWRAATAPVRTPLKQLHIWLGVLQVALLLAYLPLLSRHWRSTGPRRGQKANIALGVTALAVWGLTGLVLWFERRAPAGWSETALFWHDVTSLAVMPWVIAHGVLRWFGFKLPLPAWWLGVVNPARVDAVQARFRAARRRAIAVAVNSIAVVAAGWLVVKALKPPVASGGSPVGEPEGLLAAMAGGASEDGVQPIPPEVAAKATAPVSGGGRKGSFRIYTVTDGFPGFDPERWRFTVNGLVEKELAFTWEEFKRLPRHSQVSDFHCVTGWSVRDCTWEGVKLSHLLDLAKVKPDGKYVKFYSGDGVYTDALALKDALDDDVMVAFLLDAKQIPIPQGGPARLIVPKMYAYKSVKWLQGVELIDRPHLGFWEVRGYDTDAWVDTRKLRT